MQIAALVFFLLLGASAVLRFTEPAIPRRSYLWGSIACAAGMILCVVIPAVIDLTRPARRKRSSRAAKDLDPDPPH